MEDKNRYSLQIEALKELYASDGVVKVMLDEFASGKGNQKTTTVSSLYMSLWEAGQRKPKPELIRVLRLLGKLSCGKFVTGRKGNLTRFEWDGPKYSPLSVGVAAGGVQPIGENQGEGDQESGIEDSVEAAVDTSVIYHWYRLRADWIVDLKLPADLTAWEATRLSEFIKTLPFDAPKPVNFGDLAMYKPEH